MYPTEVKDTLSIPSLAETLIVITFPTLNLLGDKVVRFPLNQATQHTN